MLRHVFFSAPHRVMFAGGLVQLLVALLFWTLDLGGRYALLYTAPNWAWPAPWVHAGLMVFSVFPWFIFGFLMTALPKWMMARALQPQQYLPTFFLLLAGWLCFDLAAFAGLPGLLWPAVLLVALGSLRGGWVLLGLVRASQTDKRHAWVVLGAGLTGIAGWICYGTGLAQTRADLILVAETLGLFGALLPLFFAIIHRMLPVFAGSVIPAYRPYKPMFVLWGTVAALVVHNLLVIAGQDQWLWLPDAVAAGLLWLCLFHWGIRASFASALLAMLHVGALWLALALTAYAVQGILAFNGIFWGGLFPLHMLTLGFFTSILIGMATRVTLGHSGRPIETNRQAWPLFWVVQGATLLRLAGEFFGNFGLLHPNWLAAALTLAAFLGWARIYGRMYLHVRPDGQPG